MFATGNHPAAGIDRPSLCGAAVVLLLALAAAANVAPAPIAAAEPGVSRTLLVVALETPAGEATDAADPDQAEKQRVATAMVYVVAGIAVVGIALIVLIILGGHRIRQRARARSGRAPALDPLWYLRNQTPADRATGGRPPAGEHRAPDLRDPGTPS